MRRELLYGWQVQGPLDILKKACTKSTAETEERSSVKIILEMRERLETYREQEKGKSSRCISGAETMV